jgi:hypothetical protein
LFLLKQQNIFFNSLSTRGLIDGLLYLTIVNTTGVPNFAMFPIVINIMSSGTGFGNLQFIVIIKLETDNIPQITTVQMMYLL